MPCTRNRRRPPRHPASTKVAPSRRAFHVILVFVGTVLIANAIFGERGLIATRTAQHDAERLASEIELLRSKNARLREDSYRLRTDPTAIETLAKGKLGLLHRNETVFLLNDGSDMRDSQ